MEKNKEILRREKYKMFIERFSGTFFKVAMIISLILIVGILIFMNNPDQSVRVINEQQNQNEPTFYNAEILGETAYINDSNAYISVSPHTLTKSGYVTFTINSKSYTGDINVLWGFNVPTTQPISGELYNPQNISHNITNQIDLYNVTSNAGTELECEVGNDYNSIHQEVTYQGLTGANETTKVFCFDSYVNDGNDYRLTWDTTKTKYKEWWDISGELGSIDYNLDNKNKWYYALNVPISAGQEYKVRSYIKVKPNSAGKYDFAIYPSSYGANKQALIDANNDGNLYLLDPWWNSSYDEKYQHNDDGSGWGGIGYFGANVTGWYGTIKKGINASTYNDSTGSLGRIVANDTDELCWFDTRTEEASCPVKPKDLVYYFPMDLASGDVWETIRGKNATNYGATRSQTGQVYNAFDFESDDNDGVNVTGVTAFDGTQHLTASFWYKPETLHSQALYLYEQGNSGGTRFGIVSDTTGFNEYIVYGDNTAGDYGTYNARDDMSTGNWYHFVWVYDGTGVANSDRFKVYVNTTSKSISFSGGAVPTTLTDKWDTIGIGESTTLSKYSDGVMDDVRIYNKSLNSTEIQQLYDSTKDNFPYLESLDTSYPAPVVNLISPSNDTTTTNVSVDYSCNAYDDEVVENVTFEIWAENGSLMHSETNTSKINDTTYTFNYNFSSEELYDWNCYACDNKSQCEYNNTNWTIRFRTFPNMTNVNDFGSAFGFPLTRQFEVTDFSGLDSWWIDDTTNFTINSTGYLQNNTYLATGNYLLNVSVNDTKGWTTSKVIIIQIIPDTQNPQWDLIPNNESTIYGTWAGVDFDATDDVGIKDYYVNNTYFDINSLGFLSEVGSYAPAGEYNLLVSVNDTSDNQNTTEYYLEINKSSSLSASLNSNSTWTITYPTSINISYNESNTGDGDNNYKIYKEGVDIGTEDIGIFGAGTYNYLLNVTDGTNYTANNSLNTQTLNVNKFPTNLSISIDPEWKVGAGSTTAVTGSGCPTEITCVLKRDGIIVSNPDTQSFATTGNRSYVYSTTGNANYTSDSVSNILEIIENIHYEEMLQDSKNLSFNGTQNHTRWVEFELDALVTDAYFNLSSNNSANNSWIDVGEFDGDYVWNNTGSLTSEERTNNFYQDMNNVLDNGCNCTNCTIRSNFCQIPILFHSDNGTLGYITDMHNDGIIEHSQTYNNETTEGNIETFSINLSYDSNYHTNIIGRLYYNSTSYVGTITGSGNTIIFSRDIEIPFINDASENKSFYWNFEIINTLTNYENSTSHNQTITNMSIDNCGAYSNIILNYTLKDEEDQTLISSANESIEVDVTIYTKDTKSTLLEYSKKETDNSLQVCLNDNLTNSGYYMDVTTKYSADDYQTEYYNIRSYNLNYSTLTQNIILFDLLSDSATEFKIIYKDSSFNPISDALLTISRQYVGEGKFKTIEIPITDIDGEAIASLSAKDTIYTISVSKDGELLSIFDNRMPVCQDELTGECIIKLNAFSTISQPRNFYTWDNLKYQLTFNDTTNLLKLDFYSIDGTSNVMILNGTIRDRFNNNTICNEELESSSGSLTCSIADVYENSTLLVKVYKNDELIQRSTISILNSSFEEFGMTGLIMFLIMMLTIPLMFIGSLTGIVVGGLLGVFMGTFLILNLGYMGIGVTFGWLIVSAFIILWKLNKDGRGE